MSEIPAAELQKLYIFNTPLDFLRIEFAITGKAYTIYSPGRLPYMQIAETSTYPVMCPFPLSVALCDHNAPTLQTDMQTDGHTDGRRNGRQTSCS